MTDHAAVTLTVNGRLVRAAVPPLTRLLDFLREHLSLTGTKEGCGEGECGACAVIIDGRLTVSCLVPVGQLESARVTTIEGLSSPEAERLAPIQQTLLAEGGTQCGICTPGIVLAAHTLLANDPDPSLHAIREALAGNLCRCTGYTAIYAAVARAADTGR